MLGPTLQYGAQKLIVTSLLLLVVLVIFVLPQWVTDPWITENTTATSGLTQSSISPSQAAEKTRYRQEAQQILLQIISIRDSLKKQAVAQWAGFEFSQALGLIERGDTLYSYGDYSQSVVHYQRSLQQLQRLQQLSQRRLDQAITDGTVAIERAQTADISIASEAAALAVAIAPEDSRSQQLLHRANQLPKLVEAVQSAEQLYERGELEQARLSYQKALSLDGHHKRAAAALNSIQQAIAEQRFRRFMSQGYAALDADKLTVAVAAFNRAGTVYNQHDAVTRALSQVAIRESQIAVDQQMQQAAEQQQLEQWQQALSIYQSLLRADPSLTEAKVRSLSVAVRATLDTQIVAILEDPLQLTAAGAYPKAMRLLKDARGIANPGHRLKQQIIDLEQRLHQSITPVHVTLRSDNLTEVILFRIAKLGTFREKSLSLKPGRYLIAGTRLGYKDVQIEFTVSGESMTEAIEISCRESI